MFSSWLSLSSVSLNFLLDDVEAIFLVVYFLGRVHLNLVVVDFSVVVGSISSPSSSSSSIVEVVVIVVVEVVVVVVVVEVVVVVVVEVVVVVDVVVVVVNSVVVSGIENVVVGSGVVFAGVVVVKYFLASLIDWS